MEEKTEIAMMYAGGQPLSAIAKKFDRTVASIQKLISKMGVKRGEDYLNQDAGQKEQSEKKGTLKKPWYLKK